ncbi:hypothetical protein AKJ57_00195 [candidate division MSBL1 archaeon SCGC-AAA259A05]|uniref:Cation/H+ exchanger transmembrane domain-containing protein n=1 Tax=candidate division MSBL1 archaeon SCGC-AAA259A05 TaxID=1698259 RepID=A0A133UC42_9EURY|nr:hypothetical protein AKJ57_00195 [candidate division MSBL1 archaeon SCGC-AAA259A05]
MTIELPFIPALLLILLAAGAGRLLSLKINQPEIFGELILGMIIGNIIVLAPAAKGPVSDVAKMGIMLLLFLTGLSLDLERFKELVMPASGVAVGGVILPFILGYLVGINFGFTTEVALFMGASLVATSVGISASILQESGKLQTRTGTLIIDSAVADDVIGIVMMTVLFSLATTGALNLIDISSLVLFSVLFFVLSLTLGVIAIKEISQRIPIEKENLLLGGLIILLSFALITEEIGLAAVIGAFVAGLVTGQTRFVGPLTESVSLVGRGFFIPIFFVSTGMKFDLNEFTSIGFFAVVLVTLAIAGKIMGCGLGAKLFGFNNRESLAAGVAMVPRAEVALIIARFGLGNGVLDPDVFSTILVMVIVTTLLTPPVLWRILKET